jgi:hypothetical protein
LGGAINAFRREVKEGREEGEDGVGEAIRKQEDESEA